jgi:tRNA nucleotidyltransferase (CCA-adding enzyme)
MEERPSRMLEVLRACGALRRIMPELDALWGVPQPAKYHPEIDTGTHVMLVVDYAARRHYALPVRFAALLHDLGKGVTPADAWPSHHGHEGLGLALVEQLCQRLKAPSDCRDLALMTAREHGNVARAEQLRPATIVALLERCDAFRKPQRFIDMLHACACDHFGRAGFENVAFPQLAYLQAALDAAQTVDGGQIAEAYAERRQAIPIAIRAARIEEVRKLVDSLASAPDL